MMKKLSPRISHYTYATSSPTPASADPTQRSRAQTIGQADDVLSAVERIRQRRTNGGMRRESAPFVSYVQQHTILTIEGDAAEMLTRPRSDSNDFLIWRKSSKPMTIEILGALDSNGNPYVQYMGAVSCYDLCPVHGSIVLLDATLTVSVYHKIYINFH